MHNKDKSYRSRLTHGRTRTRSLPFDLGRKRLSGKAVFVLILFFLLLSMSLSGHRSRARR